MLLFPSISSSALRMASRRRCIASLKAAATIPVGSATSSSAGEPRIEPRITFLGNKTDRLGEQHVIHRFSFAKMQKLNHHTRAFLFSLVVPTKPFHVRGHTRKYTCLETSKHARENAQASTPVEEKDHKHTL